MGFSFREFAPEHRDIFYLDSPRCVQPKLITAREIPAPGDPKIE